MSDQFQIQKGVRPGCQLYSSLFVICLQVLTINIKLNKGIKDIKVGDEEIKQSIYADGATFLIMEHIHNLKILSKAYICFQNVLASTAI